MYFPTVAALRFNPLVKGFYERLVASGKPRLLALGAVMFLYSCTAATVAVFLGASLENCKEK